MADILTALTTALTDLSTNMIGVVASITPIALTVVGSVMAVTFGVGTFKSITKKS